MAPTNVDHQEGRGLVSQEVAEAPASQHFSSTASTSITVLFGLIGFLILISMVAVQRRRHRAQLQQQRILMLERLWKISPQKQC